MAASHLGPVAQIPLAMLCGTLSGGTQLTKASARLGINASPEPVIATVIILLLITLTVWLLMKLIKFA